MVTQGPNPLAGSSSHSLEPTQHSCEHLRRAKAFIGGKEEARKLHPWLVYNEFILKGYRINYHSYKILFKSLGQCHNETTNVWSHLLGVVLFICFLLFVISRAAGAAVFESPAAEAPRTNWRFDLALSETLEEKCEWLRGQSPNLLWSDVSKIVDRMKKLEIELQTPAAHGAQGLEGVLGSASLVSWRVEGELRAVRESLDCARRLASLSGEQQKLGSVFSSVVRNLAFEASESLEKWPLFVFIGCAICCFAASSVMHLLWVRSLKVCNLTHNIDLSGISLMIFGSAFGILYYVFKCERLAYWFYLAVQAAACLGIITCINLRFFNQDKYQHLKVVMFALQALVSAVALFHWHTME
jgi:adiponectin receptor